MKSLKKVLAVGLMVVMMFALASCGGEEAKVYKVATEPTFPPFDTTDESGEIIGFDMDLMKAIGEDQGFEVEFVNVGFDGLIPGLKSGNFDIVAAGMWANEERAKEVDFSEAYYESGLMLAVKQDNNIVKSINDVTPEMVVGAQIGTSSADVVKKLEEEGKIKEAKIYNGVDTAVLDLTNGTIDALINDKPVTQEYMKKQPGKIKMVGDLLTQENFGIAVAKGNDELLKKINEGLNNLKDNGKFDEIYKEWFEAK